MLTIPKLSLRDILIGLSTVNSLAHSYNRLISDFQQVSKSRPPVPDEELASERIIDTVRKFLTSTYGIELLDKLSSSIRTLLCLKFKSFPKLWSFTGSLVPGLFPNLHSFWLGPFAHCVLFIGAYYSLEYIPDAFVHFLATKALKTEPGNPQLGASNSDFLLDRVLGRPFLARFINGSIMSFWVFSTGMLLKTVVSQACSMF